VFLCTFEFLISAIPTYKLTTSGVSLGGRGSKTPTAGALGRGLIKDPLENPMASFNFTSAVLDESTTFIFGSWIYVTDGLGGFNNHLANLKEREASPSTSSSNLDDFIDNLDDMLFPDLAQQIEKMSVFNVTSTPDAPDLLKSDSK
jgi:hypothetical protein